MDFCTRGPSLISTQAFAAGKGTHPAPIPVVPASSDAEAPCTGAKSRDWINPCVFLIRLCDYWSVSDGLSLSRHIHGLPRVELRPTR
jgi:hypothetical protein